MRFRAEAYDQAVSALIEDIYERGLDKRVLVVVTGEFGRTPKINYDRQHRRGQRQRTGGHQAARPRPLAAGLLEHLGRRRHPDRPRHRRHRQARGEDVIERICGRAISWRRSTTTWGSIRRPGLHQGLQRPPHADRRPRPADPRTDGLTGELKQWHKVTLDLAGPFARETGHRPESVHRLPAHRHLHARVGRPRYTVPGYFAADGNAGEPSAEAGTVWRAHLSPDKPGRWTIASPSCAGPGCDLDGGGAQALAPFDGTSGSFTVAPPTRPAATSAPTAGCSTSAATTCASPAAASTSSRPGPDAPETLLGYADFDNTIAGKPSVPLKTWAPHVRDWREGDPDLAGGKGKGLIGALNYLAPRGQRVLVPHLQRRRATATTSGRSSSATKFHYDCSKLDQWEIVFAHAQRLGLTCTSSCRRPRSTTSRAGADRWTSTRRRFARRARGARRRRRLGPERKLYLRELIARFGHHLALNWNLGEENTQTPRSSGRWRSTSPTPIPTVTTASSTPIRTCRTGLRAAARRGSALTGARCRTRGMRPTSARPSGSAPPPRPAVPGSLPTTSRARREPACPPDPGYEGFDGTATEEGYEPYDLHGIRATRCGATSWPAARAWSITSATSSRRTTSSAEDFRSRDRSWDYCRIALEFFRAKGSRSGADDSQRRRTRRQPRTTTPATASGDQLGDIRLWVDSDSSDHFVSDLPSHTYSAIAVAVRFLDVEELR
jgi:hypothetical protein